MSDNAATLEAVQSQCGPRSAHAIAYAWLAAVCSGSPKAQRLTSGLDVRKVRSQLQALGFDQHEWGLLPGDVSARAGEARVVFLRADYRDAYDERGFDAVPEVGLILVTLRRHGPRRARRWLVTGIDTNKGRVADA